MVTTDIELAGAGYMIVPGSYTRRSDGVPEGRTGRVKQTDFFGGQRRALQLERDKGWDAVGVGPALFGQGVEPWPFADTFNDDADKVASTVRIPSTILADDGFVAIDRFLLRSGLLSSGAWISYTQILDNNTAGAGGTITALCNHQDKVAVASSTRKDITLYSRTGGITVFGGGGHKAFRLVSYGDQLIWSDATAQQETRTLMLSHGGAGAPAKRFVDSPIQQLALHAGQVAIATRSSLYLLGGQPDATNSKWLGDPVPTFTHGVWTDDEDFQFLLSSGGKLYTWLGNQVVEWTDQGDRQGWRASGLEGKSCHGACVAGGWLVVCITTRWDVSQTWAFDGSGWWLMLESASQTRVWPTYTGGAGNFDVVTFRDGSASMTYDRFRLVHRSHAANTYRTDATYKTSLWHAGEPDAVKSWRKLGANFTSPEPRGDQSSSDSVTVALSYSVDGGKTFTQVASVAGTDPTDRDLELDAELASAAAASRTIQLKVDWTSVLDWARVLTGIWAEYAVLTSAAHRRRWTLAVICRDATVKRDGAVESRSGHELAADLWEAWQDGLTVTLRDLDFDVTATTYAVRIVDIAEQIPKPGDAGDWGHSTVMLTLLEV